MKKHRWLRCVAVVSALASPSPRAAVTTTTTTRELDHRAPRPPRPRDRGNVDGTLTVGALLPQSGDLAVIYDALHVPVTMAIDEINAAGGVNGKPVVLKDADDGTVAGRRRPRLDTLLNSDKVDVIVGPASSGTMEGIVDKVASNGVVDVLGVEHVGRADHGQGRRLLLPHRAAGQVPGPGARAAHPRATTRRRSRSSPGTTPTAPASRTRWRQALTDGGADVVDQRGRTTRPRPTSTSTCSKVVAHGAGRGRRDRVQRRRRQDREGDDRPERRARTRSQIYTADGMQSSKFGTSVDAANPGVVAGIKGTARPRRRPVSRTRSSPTYAATGNDTIFSSYYYDCTMLLALARTGGRVG